MNPEENSSHLHFLSKEEVVRSRNSLIISMLLSMVIFSLELYGAILSNSLALLSDAFHIITDILAHFISLIAIYFSLQKRTLRFNFGFLRFEILAAFLNSVLLLSMCFFLIKESIERMIYPGAIETDHMLAYSLMGLFLNSLSAIILFRVSHTSINLKSAYIHVLGDLLGTFAVVVGALIIKFTGLTWVDSIMSFFIVIIIGRATFYLLKETGSSLLEASPNADKLKDILEETKKKYPHTLVLDSKHWNLTAGVECINLRLLLKNKNQWESLTTGMHKLLKEDFGITHVSIEIVTKESRAVLDTIRTNREKIHAHGNHGHHHGHHHHSGHQHH